jgi:hypothetical protein
MMPAPIRSEFAPLTEDVSQRIRLLSSSLRVSDVSFTQSSVVAYFRSIAPEKLELALAHALEVGVAELLARRTPR